MAITDIQISEELETNAPSIKYSGNEGPKSPEEEKRKIMAKGMGYSDEEIIEYEQYRIGMQEGKPGYPILEIDDYFQQFGGGPAEVRGIKSLGEEMQMAGMMDEIALSFKQQNGYDISLANPEVRENFIQQWKEENFYDDFSRGPVQGRGEMQMAGGENNRVRELLYKEETEGLTEDEKEELRQLIKTISAQGPILPSPEDPVNPFQPQPQGPTLPDRQMAAYGGIMGLDGRKQYGIGSWFQKAKDKFVDDVIPNEIKDNPLLAAAVIAGGAHYLPGSPLQGFMEPIVNKVRSAGTGIYNTGKRVLDMEMGDGTVGESIRKGIASNIVPLVGGSLAGLFTKATEGDTPGLPSDNTALQLADLKKSANLLNQQQAMSQGLNFTPAVSARKFTPEEMAITYAQAAANGGRIGYAFGKGVESLPVDQMQEIEGQMAGGGDRGWRAQVLADEIAEEEYGVEFYDLPQKKQFEIYNIALDMIDEQGMAQGGRIGYAGGGSEDPMLVDEYKKYVFEMEEQGLQPMSFDEFKAQALAGMASGGRAGRAEGGLMDLGGMEKDYRAEGGFVPIGAKEKADDVPARLSVNEFVFTADAVRNAGGGDIDKGAEVMENMMKNLEAGGQVSEESQGMQGAQQMFETSERLSEVI